MKGHGLVPLHRRCSLVHQRNVKYLRYYVCLSSQDGLLAALANSTSLKCTHMTYDPTLVHFQPQTSEGNVTGRVDGAAGALEGWWAKVGQIVVVVVFSQICDMTSDSSFKNHVFPAVAAFRPCHEWGGDKYGWVSCGPATGAATAS